MGVNPVNCLSPLEIAISPKNHPQKSRFLETKLKLRKILSIKPYIKMWYSENSDKIAIIKWSQNFKIFQIEQNLLLSQKGIFWNFQRPISPCPWRPQTCQVFFWSQHQKYYHPYKYQPKFLIHNARTLCNGQPVNCRKKNFGETEFSKNNWHNQMNQSEIYKHS